MSCPFIVVKILCHLFLVRCFINKIQIDLRGNTKFKICPAKVLRVKFLFVSIGVKLPTSFVSQNVCVYLTLYHLYFLSLRKHEYIFLTQC